MNFFRGLAPALLLLSACVAPHSTRGGNESATERFDALPAWRYEPLSWNKLEAIETWLGSGETFGAPSGLVAQAHLELAEGRLSFAEREHDRVESGVLAERLRASREDFETVLSDPEATADQRSRARRGLQRAGSVQVIPSTQTDRVVSRGEWRSRAAARTRLTPHQGQWTRITVHHSAMHSKDLGGTGLADSAEHLRRIQRFHMDEESWGDIGYHFLIDPQGRLFEGREIEWRGAHAGGKNNVGNLGVCLLGDFDQERPSPGALQTLDHLLADLRRSHAIPRSSVFAHQDFKTTECPGTNLLRFVESYRRGSDGSAVPLARSGAAARRRGTGSTLPASARAAKVR